MSDAIWLALALAAGAVVLTLGADAVGRLALAAGRSFREGDRVRIGEEEGRVLAIGLRASRLRTRDGEIVTVPHRRLLTETVGNADAPGAAARVVAETGLPAHVDPALARRLAREAALSSRFARLDVPVEVSLEGRVEAGTGYLLRVRARAVDPDDAERLRTEILEGLHGALGERREGGRSRTG